LVRIVFEEVARRSIIVNRGRNVRMAGISRGLGTGFADAFRCGRLRDYR